MSDEIEKEDEELKEPGDSLNPDAIEEALGEASHGDEFEEDDSDGVYLKPKKAQDSEENEDDIDVSFEDDDSALWKL